MLALMYMMKKTKMTKNLTILLVFLIANGTSTLAQNYSDALAVYKSGQASIALKMFTRLADQDDLEAQCMLSSIYTHGDVGISSNPKLAFKWAYAAATNESLGSIYNKARGQYHVGYSYAFGSGATLDYSLAYVWMAVAMSNDAYGAESMLAWLSHKLSAADISKAQAMARECMSSGYKKCGY